MPSMKLPALVLTALAVFLTACADNSSPIHRATDSPALGVVVEAISEAPELTRVEAVGTSRAIQSITVYPATSGEVVAVNFEPGQAVEKGQVLVELDRRDEQLAVELAELRVTDAERLYRRYQLSADSGATLPTTLDAAATALEEARIQLGRARIALDYRSIKAPFSGHVGITDVDPGDRIQPSTAITTLDDRNALLVSFAVPELLVGRLRAGDAVAIATWNSREASAFGEIVTVDSRVDPTTRTFLARAQVNNSADALRPGQSFRVTLEILGDQYPVLPEVAVQWGADGAYIWSVADQQAQQVGVNIIQRQEGRVLVEGLVDGLLKAGDWVVVEGIQRLRPGIAVEPSLASPASDVGATAERQSTTGPG
jgi:membrane fusion protein, multidrug efflux system